jgi:hypothetical protein
VGRSAEDEATDPPATAGTARADDTVEVDAVSRRTQKGGAGADGSAGGDPDLPRNDRDRVSNSR